MQVICARTVGQTAGMAYDFELLHVRSDDGVVHAVVDNPPINLMTVPLLLELSRFAEEVAADEAARVVVLGSDNPEFFIAHFDVEAILQFPTDQAPARDENLN